MKFKNYIETESGIKDTSTSPGTAGQLLSSTVAGTSWIDQDTIHSGSSEVIDIQIKNISSADGGINLSKGDPVYIYGSVGASPRLYVDLADADSTATNNLGDSKMPCVALLDQDLSPNGEGTATVVGKLRNLITNPIDGNVPNENDTVYVKSGGGLTLTKPAGSTNLIQNVGQVGRVSTSADGNIVVAALLRTNDVPNLPEGRLFVGTATNTSLTSDVVYVDDTNERMGIGTASPNAKLHVDSDGDSIVALFDNISGTYARVRFRDQFGESSIGTVSDNLIFTTGVSLAEAMRVNNNQDVGIGTTFPTEKLTVGDNTSSAAVKIISYNNAVGTEAILKFCTTTSTNTKEKAAIIVKGLGGSFGKNDMHFALDSAADDENVQFSDTKMTILNGGNVGIGITQPQTKLHLGTVSNSGATIEELRIEAGDGGGYGGTAVINLLTGQYGNSGIYFGDQSTYSSQPAFIEFLDSPSTLTYKAPGGSGSHAFKIGTSEKVTIKSNGKVGIGTTIPTSKLHSVTTESGPVDYTNRAAILGVNDSTDTLYANSVGVAGKVSTSGGFAIYGDASGAGGWAGYFDGKGFFSGNVGIGTTSPGSKLTVNGSTQLGGNVEVSDGLGGDKVLTLGANNGYFSIGDIDGLGDFAFINGDSSSISISTNQITTLHCDSNNRVGIGTTSPQEKLHVSGSSNIRLEVEATDSTVAALKLTNTAGSYASFVNASGDLSVYDYNANDTRTTLLANGNFGIGTTSPSYKLDVNGEIHSSTYVSATAGLGVDNTNGTLGRGISLYNGPSLYPQYGLLFAQTVDLGTYGGVSGDWATYMTMSGTATRGWIWKAGTTNSTGGNVASISGVGQLTLASTATATNFILSSDETLKDNIKEIDTKHVDVDWKNFELKSEPGIKRAGVIAQELEIKHPEFVRTADNGLKSVAYIDLLITKIAELEARLGKLEK